MQRLIISLLFATAIMSAGSVTYNFENKADTNGNGQLTSLTDVSAGLTMTVTRQNGAAFDISDISSYIPASYNFGKSTLDPFFDTSANAFIFTFSAPVNSFSVQLGDFGGDTDTQVLKAYSGKNGTGSLLANATGTWGNRNLTSDSPQTDFLSASGIMSVVVIGGSASFPNSLYYDNVMVSTTPSVPEPGSLLLMGYSLAALFCFRLAKGDSSKRLSKSSGPA